MPGQAPFHTDEHDLLLGYVHQQREVLRLTAFGLTDEQLPRMFEPFYTTKADGMGLGLAICQTIMNAHDGNVAVQRNVERGTTFSFSLPSLPPDETAVPAAIGDRTRL